MSGIVIINRKKVNCVGHNSKIERDGEFVWGGPNARLEADEPR